MRFHRVTDREWAAQRVAQLPPRWRGRLLATWERQRDDWHRDDWFEFESVSAGANANRQLREVTEQLDRVRVPLDASDSEICGAAEKLANQCMGSGQLWGASFGMGLPAVRASMERFCRSYGVEPPPSGEKGVSDHGAIARMTDALWWRRALRKMHAKAVEATAIRLGYVNRAADPYVSNESLARRVEQNARNAATLEGTIARNELGQEFTLAELAAKGTANKAIRRAELMTRIAGFERIARDLGHAGLFMTITCPSRMHKWATVKNRHGQAVRVRENKRYDGTKPNEAQKYLAQVWARIRAALARKGVGIYGFRIAEPNHDGTPHWHLLVFHESGLEADVEHTVRRYALEDSPDERGADLHRVDFKPIDWSRGTAAGYIAKYVAKNIDGYRLDKDLLGNDALETSARVEAWATTWGIRQFQQVGGPPVGPWRELRRVEAVPEGAPLHLKAAHDAVNKTAVIEGRDNASVAWDRYCRAQGGVFCGRAYRIKVATAEGEGTGRYGDPKPPRPIGVETTTQEIYTPAHMAHMGGKASRLVHWVIESSRHAWEIVGRAARAIGRVFMGRCEAPAPWTCVNNCTEGVANGHHHIEGAPGKGPSGLGQGASSGAGDGGGLCGTADRHAGGHGGHPGTAGAVAVSHGAGD